MPHVDDSDAMAVCGAGDDAFVIVDDLGTTEEDRDHDDDPYAPAESLRLRIGEDIDWSDVVVGAVAVLQRDDSTKGAGANPKSAARRSVQQQQQSAPRSSMSSAAAQRKKAVAVVIGGLPPAAAGSMVARERRCSPSPCRVLGGRARVFAAGEQQAVANSYQHLEEEPVSPKVSCLGAVRPEQQHASGGTASRRAWRSWLAPTATCCFWSHRR